MATDPPSAGVLRAFPGRIRLLVYLLTPPPSFGAGSLVSRGPGWVSAVAAVLFVLVFLTAFVIAALSGFLYIRHEWRHG